MISKTKSFIKLFKFLFCCKFPRLKKVYKHLSYRDLENKIAELNFAIILDFWYQQIKESDWDWTELEDRKNFYKWIKNTVEYIENERPLLLNKIKLSLDEASSHKEVSKDTIKLYREYRELNIELQEKDNSIITELLKYRNYFWA